MWKLIEGLSQWREDVFFYLLYPEKYLEDEDQIAWIAEQLYRERVRVVPKRYDPLDRVREMFQFDDEMMGLSAIGASPFYDFDVVLTSRISQLAMFKMTTRESTAYAKGSFRAVIGLDEMPIFSFQESVPWGDRGEIHTLANYLIADGVVVNNLWALEKIKNAAKTHLSPADLLKLDEVAHEAVPVKLQRLNLRPTKQGYHDGDAFTLAFTGRITGTRNFKAVAELFRQHFSYPLTKNKDHLKFVVSTNSKSSGSSNYGEIDFIEFQYNSRAKFHEFLTHEATAVVNLSEVEDFSLSTYEPLLFGLPVIVADRPWSQFLGKDYPFRVKGAVEAYALVKALIEDYPTQYTKLRQWEETTWKAIVEGPTNTTTCERVQRKLAQFEEGANQYVKETGIGGKYKLLADAAQQRGKTYVDLLSMIELEEGKLDRPLEKTPLMKRPDIQILKLLMYQRGYVDTLRPGIMMKVGA
jgi:hypothetical protein